MNETRKITILAACGIALAAAFSPAVATTPEHMMAQCRNRAHEALRIRLPDIDTKYEGQRADGTHAVNGTATIRDKSETFQCSFNRAGSHIVNFSVNRAAAPPPQDARIATRRVQFPRGRASATVQGRISGDQIIDYVVGARAGQHANISLGTSHGATYFNIIAPGETDVAMFVGSSSGNQFEGALPKDGDYKIRVYMMRSAARRAEAANYRLEVAIAAGHAASGGGRPSGDALVPGTNFHATGSVDCTMGSGQPTGQCPFGVKREGRGQGMVTLTKPDGRQRVIFFADGKATNYDQSQADTGAFRATRQGDLHIIHIGPERYEILDAMIFGG